MYQVSSPPANKEELESWVIGELLKVSAILQQVFSGYILPELSVAPTKPKERQLAFADGVNWNPGSGKGVYCYYNSTWHFLG